MKKVIPIVLIFSLLVFGGFFFFARTKKAPEKKPLLQETSLPLEERPFVSLIPVEDGHYFNLKVEKIKNADSVDYELLYMSDDLSRGVIGSVEVNGQDFFEKEILLGSCSRNVCRYDENITGGSLTLKLRGASGVQKYVVPFSLHVGSSKIEKFTLEEGFSVEGKFAKGLYLLSSPVGIPQMPEKEVIGGPFSVFTQEEKNQDATVQIKLNKASSKATVLLWDKNLSSWKILSSGFETDGEVVRVETDTLSTFVVVE